MKPTLSLGPLTTCLVLLAVFGPQQASASDEQRRAFFEKRIRPALVEHCYECHSAKSKPIKGGLRVDTAKALLQGGDSGPAVVGGKPEESLLLEALRYESFEMPPDRRLPDNVVADFETWIKDGAFDPRVDENANNKTEDSIEQRLANAKELWAFQIPARAATPEFETDAWSRNWVDRFLRQRWKDAGVRANQDAEKATFARRVYFDLTGLPPSEQELQRYLIDDSPDSRDRLIDELLASRAFAEHWGRMWLDVARYADSNGGDFNATFHEAWRYRNYVIEAFGDDKPYDAFVREQLAGDILPANDENARAQQLVASGFLMLGPKMLSERDKLKLQMDVVDEQVSSVGQAFMGLTLGCARCHDHKFDPVPMSDYYALAGIFRSTQTLDGEIQKYVSNWVRQPLPASEERRQAVADHKQRTADVKKQVDSARKERDALTKKIDSLRDRLKGDRLLADDSTAKKVGAWKASALSPPFIGVGYVHDNDDGKGDKSIAFSLKLPADGLYEVRVAYSGHRSRAAKTPVIVEHGGETTTVTLNQQTPPKFKPFHPVGQFRFTAAQPAVVTLRNDNTKGYVIADAIEFVPIDVDAKQLAATKSAGDSEEPSQENELKQALAKAQSELKAKAAALKSLEETASQLKKDAPAPLPRALTPVDSKEIGDCHICIRGEHRNLGDVAPRGFLKAASDGPYPTIGEKESGRRELAEWIASPRNPLAARVMVNRIWRRLMGEGIVRTVDNFGALGEPPSHPELLDSLAVEFTENGWSVKHIVRLIAMSRVYSLSSQHDEDNHQADPQNRLLWRAHRKPATAESIRDAMLQVSGEIDRSRSDSPVASLGTLVTQNSANDKGYQGSASNRRTVYAAVIRNELSPQLTLFDFADPDFVVGRRASTTTPAQSLYLMNSPFVRQRAERTVERLQDESNDDSRLQRLYIRLVSRTPTKTEQRFAREFLDSMKDRDEAWIQLTHALLASTEFRLID